MLGFDSLRTQHLGSQETQACWVHVWHWVRKEPKRAGFASGVGFAFGAWFASGAGFAGFASGAGFAGFASRFAPNPTCLGLVEPRTLGFGSLRTQALGSQEPKPAGFAFGFLQTQHAWVPCEPRCWVRLQVLGSKSNLAGGGFEQLLSSCK
ncbi:hypothetical protein SLEP1_g7665 [Rubroshorea leprosula]|uniref:Uncharacterized protein n=1 Tax=Rubroshorea leprosula TaxID=152421 RepID=A0AAV5I5F8_9ROSI|nr:hypothetical protein SLEP1_g7665 [Rubroshorea leprosula]